MHEHSPVNRYFIDFYYEFKRRNGYSEQQIARKSYPHDSRHRRAAISCARTSYV